MGMSERLYEGAEEDACMHGGTIWLPLGGVGYMELE